MNTSLKSNKSCLIHLVLLISVSKGELYVLFSNKEKNVTNQIEVNLKKYIVNYLKHFSVYFEHKMDLPNYILLNFTFFYIYFFAAVLDLDSGFASYVRVFDSCGT